MLANKLRMEHFNKIIKQIYQARKNNNNCKFKIKLKHATTQNQVMFMMLLYLSSNFYCAVGRVFELKEITILN